MPKFSIKIRIVLHKLKQMKYYKILNNNISRKIVKGN